jgi:hypothetical protein
MYLEALSVLDAFDRQAVLTPTAVAVIDGDARLTYAELRHKAEGLAAAATRPASRHGRWIGFFPVGELRKVSITGGPSIALCRGPGRAMRRQLGAGRHHHLGDRRQHDALAERARGRRRSEGAHEARCGSW